MFLKFEFFYNKVYDLTLSLNKSHIMTNNDFINSWKVGPQGETIEESITAKYLGIDVTLNHRNITFYREEKVIKEAKAKAHTIQGLTRSGLERANLTKELWEKCAVPSILYCSETLLISKQTINKLETVQNQISRFILQIPPSSANIMVWTDAGLMPIYGRIWMRKACYFWNLYHSTEDVLLKQCFDEITNTPDIPNEFNLI